MSLPTVPLVNPVTMLSTPLPTSNATAAAYPDCPVLKDLPVSLVAPVSPVPPVLPVLPASPQQPLANPSLHHHANHALKVSYFTFL